MTSARELLAEIRSRGISVSVEGERIVAKGPKGALTPHLLEQLKANKPEIIEVLKSAGPGEPHLRADDGTLPLARAQQRIWFLDRLDPGNPVWNIAGAFRVEGRLDRGILERCFREILRRHEVLRTSFTAVDGEPRARLIPGDGWSLEYVDLRGVPTESRHAAMLKKANQEAQTPFDLMQGPLFRVTLLQVAEEDHLLIIATHHIVADGWSLGVISKELATLYDAFSAGRPSPLAELPRTYRGYVDWERANEAATATDLAWWREKLGGDLPALELPTDRPRFGKNPVAGRRVSMAIPADVSKRLGQLARDQGVTTFMLLLAAFKVLLCRYTGVDDVLVGTATSYRNHQDFADLVGMFVNNLVLRTDLSGNPQFSDLLRRVKDTAIQGYAHQSAPFDRVVEMLQPDRRANQAPLFQVMFAFQNIPLPALRLGGLKLTQERLDLAGARYDLSVEIWDTPHGFSCDFEFPIDLWDEASIRRMQAHYRLILEQCAAEPATRILDIPLLTETERRQIFADWNSTAHSYPQLPVHAVFEREAHRHPAAVAVTSGQQQLSYGDLNSRANQMARRLRELGVTTETSVGLALARSPDMIVAMLAVLKAGGAYVPLDLNYPVDRLRALLDDSGIRLLVVDSGAMAEKLGADANIELIDLAALAQASLGRSTDDPGFPAGPDQLAYVMYTSGTTGTPNGVEVTHRGIVRLVVETNYVELGSDTVSLNMAPCTFDAATFEIWAPLLNGGRCVLYPGQLPDIATLSSVLREQAVNTLWLTASVFNWVIDTAPGTLTPVRQLLVGGEALSVRHVQRALKELPGTTIINGYGPTENTTFTCCYSIPRDLDPDVHSVPLGRPISNTTAFILDAHLQPTPVGVVGELCAGGDGLARGYRNKPELTAEKFIVDPSNAAARLYRTGDLVRHLADGNIQFIGRRDHQVKVRGHRIELAEIERLLCEHTGVKTAVAEVRRSETSGDAIVVWFVPVAAGATNAEDVRTYVEARLPRYMIPNFILAIPEIPLLASGKVDRTALAARPLPKPHAKKASRPPRNETERLIAEVMAKVLDLDHVEVDDDFFSLGGHSMLVLKFVARLEQVLSRSVSSALLFQAPTVAALTAFFEKDDYANGHLVALRPTGSRPPLFCVHGLDAGVHDFLNLIQHLDSEQPVFGLRPGPLADKLTGNNALEMLATAYAAEIRRSQPSGPYWICGYSFGGSTAYEVARQLARERDDVTLLLIDAFNFHARPLSLRFARILAKTRRCLRLLTQWQFGAAVREALDTTPMGTADVPEWISESKRTLAVNLARATLKHVLRPSRALGVLFQVRDRGAILFPDFDGQNGWRGLLRSDFSVISIEADHLSVMRADVAALARQLTAVLANPLPSSNGTEPLTDEMVGAGSSSTGSRRREPEGPFVRSQSLTKGCGENLG